VLRYLAQPPFPADTGSSASALTAISPHLVTMNIYLLSETLFISSSADDAPHNHHDGKSGMTKPVLPG
jgi:hypothetical protein